MIVAATGHRPDKLGGYGLDVERRLVALARDHLSAVAPTRVIVGMALGWDQAVAQAAVDLGLPFTAAVPFEGQEGRCPTFSRRAMQQRNEWMVDRCDQIAALWDGSFGGTFNCLEYARKRQRPVTNLWSAWQPQDGDSRGLSSPFDFSDLLA